MNNVISGSVSSSLKQVKETVDRHTEKNKEHIDIITYFTDPASANKYSTETEHGFIKNPTISFPETLAAEVEKLDFNYKMGFLSSINHMWFASGKTLLIWNYLTENAITRIDSKRDNIENVDLINMLTHSKLVVSTQKHIFLYKILDSDENSKLEFDKQELIIIKTDDVIMSNFQLTNTRRIFMQGSDGHLYELKDLETSRAQLLCHTASPLSYYFSYVFKSKPEVPVKSMVVDDFTKVLFILLKDSSIHTVDIAGSNYLPIARHEHNTANGNTLESLHPVPEMESKQLNLIAVSNKGERLYFYSDTKKKRVEHKYTIPPPPTLPGSLLFNNFAEQTCQKSFYDHGIFAAALSKSERKFLVLTGANLVKDTNDPSKSIYKEDVYHEEIEKNIWSIIESTPKVPTEHYFKETLESPDDASVRRISTLSESGITHYTKQRPVDYLIQVLLAEDQQGIANFVHHYGAVEAYALGFLLACSSKHSPQIVDFLQKANYKEEGFLLYFARIVEKIWKMDIIDDTRNGNSPEDQFSQGKFKAVQARLRTLLRLIYQADIKVEKEHVDLITRTIEGISLVCFVRSQDWLEIKESLSPFTTSCEFAQFVSTEQGALLAKEMALASIRTTTKSDSSNNYGFVSDFLMNHCSAFLGEYNITYYKGMECLQGAIKENSSTHDKHAALELSLGHFKKIIQLLDLGTLQPICHDYSKLGSHLNAIKLAYAKHQTGTSPDPKIYDIIFTAMQDALANQQQQRDFVQKILRLTNEEGYHYEIYNWLMQNGHRNILVTLKTPLLAEYIKTQLPPVESLACLRSYHDHRQEYGLAVDCLLQMATTTDHNIKLEDRVKFLQAACDYLPTSDISKQQEKELRRTSKEAQYQLDLYDTLIKKDSVDAKLAAAELANCLLPAETLFHKFAYTHQLYEQALCLMHLLDLYDWDYQKLAWTHIIDECKNEEELKSKILQLSRNLYPSIASFPVYYITEALEKHHPSQDFTRNTLVQAGIPEDVVQDAITCL